MERTLTVAAGPLDRTLCPARAIVPDIEPTANLSLVEIDSGRDIPVQVVPGGVVWLLDGLPRGQVRRYRFVEAEQPTFDGFGLEDRAGEALDFTVGGKPFTSYNYAAKWARPFFHPVVASGRRVTRAWPMEEVPCETRDHPHHKGILGRPRRGQRRQRLGRGSWPRANRPPRVSGRLDRLGARRGRREARLGQRRGLPGPRGGSPDRRLEPADRRPVRSTST